MGFLLNQSATVKEAELHAALWDIISEILMHGSVNTALLAHHFAAAATLDFPILRSLSCLGSAERLLNDEFAFDALVISHLVQRHNGCD